MSGQVSSVLLLLLFVFVFVFVCVFVVVVVVAVAVAVAVAVVVRLSNSLQQKMVKLLRLLKAHTFECLENSTSMGFQSQFHTRGCWCHRNQRKTRPSQAPESWYSHFTGSMFQPKKYEVSLGEQAVHSKSRYLNLGFFSVVENVSVSFLKLQVPPLVNAMGKLLVPPFPHT